MNILEHMTRNMPTIEQVVVEHDGKHYLISNNKKLEETLAFRCKRSGEVANYVEVAGGKGMTIADVMVDIVQGKVWSYFGG